jgi:hypothetical protein
MDSMKKKTVKKKVNKRPPRVTESKLEKPEKPASKSKFIKVGLNEPESKFVEMGEMVNNKEVKWAYFSSDGSTGYHYYLILKHKK